MGIATPRDPQISRPSDWPLTSARLFSLPGARGCGERRRAARVRPSLTRPTFCRFAISRLRKAETNITDWRASSQRLAVRHSIRPKVRLPLRPYVSFRQQRTLCPLDVGLGFHTRRLTCGDQSGRTSAPIYPHWVQAIRRQSDRTGTSSGSQSPPMVAL